MIETLCIQGKKKKIHTLDHGPPALYEVTCAYLPPAGDLCCFLSLEHSARPPPTVLARLLLLLISEERAALSKQASPFLRTS